MWLFVVVGNERDSILKLWEDQGYNCKLINDRWKFLHEKRNNSFVLEWWAMIDVSEWGLSLLNQPKIFGVGLLLDCYAPTFFWHLSLIWVKWSSRFEIIPVMIEHYIRWLARFSHSVLDKYEIESTKENFKNDKQKN